MSKKYTIYQSRLPVDGLFNEEIFKKLLLIPASKINTEVEYVSAKNGSIMSYRYTWEDPDVGQLVIEVTYSSDEKIIQIHAEGYNNPLINNRKDYKTVWRDIVSETINKLIQHDGINLTDKSINELIDENHPLHAKINTENINNMDITIPCVVFSRDKDGRIPVDLSLLNPITDGLFQFIFKQVDDNKDEKIKDGNVGIFLPDKTTIVADPRKFKTSDAFFQSLLDIITSWHMTRYDRDLSFDTVSEQNLKERIEELKSKNQAHAEKNESDYEKMVDEIDTLEREIVSKQNRINALELELDGLKKSISPENKSLINYGKEEDLFQGEIKDLLLMIMKEALDNTLTGTRRHDVLTDILDNNDYKKIHEELETTIKNQLTGCMNMTSEKLINDLGNTGIKVIKGRKHNKLIMFGDNRYAVTMASTPSNKYAGVMIAREINNMIG